jgi:hypothetical protein
MHFSILRLAETFLIITLRIRQGVHNEIEPQPQTPTVMIKSYWKNQRHQNQDHEHARIARIKHQQKGTDYQDQQFGYHYICEKRPYEQNIFTLEHCVAVRAAMPDPERLSNNLRLAACRTTQSETAPQDRFHLLDFLF